MLVTYTGILLSAYLALYDIIFYRSSHVTLHYLNGISHSLYGNSYIEAKPQLESHSNGSFNEKFPYHHANNGIGFFD